MSEINAVQLKDFIGASSTPDGTHGLYTFETVQGPITLALPAAHLPKLMAATSSVAADTAKIKTANKDQKHAFPCVFWNVADDGTGAPMLSFKVPGGMELSFVLDKSSLPLLCESLNALQSK